MADRYEKRPSNGSNGSVNSPRVGSQTQADPESPVLLAGLPGYKNNSNNNNNRSGKSMVDMIEGDEDEVFVRRDVAVPRRPKRSRGYGHGPNDDSSEQLLCSGDENEESDKLNEADYAFTRSHANRVRSAWKTRARRSLCACGVLLLILGALVGGTVLALRQLSSENGVAMLDEAASQQALTHGCDELQVEDVWVVGFPKLITESSFRLLDANADGVLDIVFGYGTAADNLETDPLYCAIYFNGTEPCFGGVRCLDGRNGAVLWDAPTEHEVYALNCGADLDGDTVLDCVAAGRGSVFLAVSGRNGAVIWRFGSEARKTTPAPNVAQKSGSVDEDGEKEELVRFSNMYTAALVGDVDQDGVLDLAQVHGGDPLADPTAPRTLSAALLLVSGRTGRLLRSVSVPDHTESYSSPLLLSLDDGLPALVYGTGGETHGGSLWRVKLADLLDGRAEQRSVRLASDATKGWMTPCAFVDLNMDNVADLVCVAFNSTVYALDGRTWRTLWTFSEPVGESYATPAIGYFNDDDIPDVAVQFNVGDSFPIYYFAVTLLLDGRTGHPIVQPTLRPVYSLIATQASPLAISLDGHGHDLVLFWSATCSSVTSDNTFARDASAVLKAQDGLFTDGMSDAVMRDRFMKDHQMQFLRGTEASAQSRIDFCAQRFDNTTRTRPRSFAFATGSSLPSGLGVVYDESLRDDVEHRWISDTQAELIRWLDRNPKYKPYYKQYADQVRRIQEVDLVAQTKGQGKSDTRSTPDLPSNSKARKLDSNTNDANEDANTNDDAAQSNMPADTAPAADKQRSATSHSAAPATDYEAESNGNEAPARRINPKSKYARNGMQTEQLDEADEAAMVDQPVSRRVDRTRNDVSQNDTPKSTRSRNSNARDAQTQTQAHAPAQSPSRAADSPDEHEDTGVRSAPEPENESDNQPRVRASSEAKKPTAPKQPAASKQQPTSTYDNLADALKAGFPSETDSQTQQKAVPNSESDSGADATASSSTSSFRREQGRPRRAKRHVGAHDGEGLQRVISTGTLAPPLNANTNVNQSQSHSSIDYVFATYWFPPRRATLLYADEQLCVDQLLAQEGTLRGKPPFKGMDHDRFVHAVAKRCLEQSSHGSDRAAKLQIDAANPFELNAGQLTVYRLRLTCKCKSAPTAAQTGRCARILPFEQQRWASYLGSNGNGLFRP